MAACHQRLSSSRPVIPLTLLLTAHTGQCLLVGLSTLDGRQQLLDAAFVALSNLCARIERLRDDVLVQFAYSGRFLRSDGVGKGRRKRWSKGRGLNLREVEDSEEA